MIKCPDQKGASEEESVMPGGGYQTVFLFLPPWEPYLYTVHRQIFRQNTQTSHVVAKSQTGLHSKVLLML